MDGSRGLPRSVLDASVSIALHGAAHLPHYVVVHDVDGTEPGLYRWPDLSTPVRCGALRDELLKVCLNQDLAYDAVFVVISAVDVGGLYERDYREAQLAAGMVSGRLHLLAYGLGASASGMTFIDSGIPAFLGDDSLRALLFTCVGVPQYRSAAAGPPGAPTEVRDPQPRIRRTTRESPPGEAPTHLTRMAPGPPAAGVPGASQPWVRTGPTSGSGRPSSGSCRVGISRHFVCSDSTRISPKASNDDVRARRLAPADRLRERPLLPS